MQRSEPLNVNLEQSVFAELYAVLKLLMRNRSWHLQLQQTLNAMTGFTDVML